MNRYPFEDILRKIVSPLEPMRDHDDSKLLCEYFKPSHQRRQRYKRSTEARTMVMPGIMKGTSILQNQLGLLIEKPKLAIEKSER